MPEQNRKLAAVLFADIVGYTALMQKDEKEARRILDKFKDTLNEKVAEFNGHIVNDLGDGCLCTFGSAVDAVKCAMLSQQLFQTEPVSPVRMGLHSGDVFIKDGNVYGDSVNIASRIESLGVAGSVLVIGVANLFATFSTMKNQINLVRQEDSPTLIYLRKLLLNVLGEPPSASII